MTVKEVFKKWKKKKSDLGIMCEYGGFEGGPGWLDFGECKHKNHPNVRYGCEFCPKKCPDFVCQSDGQLWSTFMTLYRKCSESMNKEYNIDPNDEYYYEQRPYYPDYSYQAHSEDVIDPTSLF